MLGRLARPQDDPEATRVSQSQAGLLTDHEVEMLVGAGGRGERHQAQAPRHPEMQDHRSGPGLEEEVLAAPAHGGYGLAG